MDTDFIKKLYFTELQRKQEFDSAPNVPIAVLTVVGGALAFYLSAFSWRSPVLSVIFAGFLVVAGVLAILSIVWIIRSYIGAEYEYLPYADELFVHFNALLEHFGDEPPASDDFTNTLRARMVSATASNQYANNRRSELVFATKRFVAALVIVTLVAGIPPGIEWLTDSASNLTIREQHDKETPEEAATQAEAPPECAGT